MLNLIPFHPSHLLEIELQPAQAVWRDRIVEGRQAELINVPGMCWSGVYGDMIVGAAGFVPQWEGRIIAWALLSPKIPKTAWTQIARAVRGKMQELFSAGVRRIEITVPVDFEAGIRFAEILGFKSEGTMRCFQPDGSDAVMYAKVRYDS